METQIVQIEIPKGFKIDQNKSTFEKIVLKDVSEDIIERVKTMRDIYQLCGTTKAEFDKKWQGFSSDEIGYAKEVLIVKAYNDGWTPSWKVRQKLKYYPWFNMGENNFSYGKHYIRGLSSDAPANLCFKSKELMEDAVKKFLPEYKQSRLMNK